MLIRQVAAPAQEVLWATTLGLNHTEAPACPGKAMCSGAAAMLFTEPQQDDIAQRATASGEDGLGQTEGGKKFTLRLTANTRNQRQS